VRPLACNLYDAAQCRLLILKLAERGALVCRGGDHESLDSFFAIDSFAEQVVDAVGAGDALLAYATLALLAARNETIASILGTLAAACECECDGNVPVTPEDVHQKLDLVERQINFG
jgi:sugar/nucleoside kinase (ribokinase family)